MDRPKALLSSPCGRALAVALEFVLVGCAALLCRYLAHRARDAHTARAQSRHECSQSAPCPEGALCEVTEGAGQCVGVFDDAQGLWQEARAWVGRRVVIRHASIVPDPTEYTCTLRGCAGPCCNNACWSKPRLANAAFRDIAGVECLGTECDAPVCGVMLHHAFWLLKDEVELRGKVRAERDGFSIEDIDVNRLLPQAPRSTKASP